MVLRRRLARTGGSASLVAAVLVAVAAPAAAVDPIPGTPIPAEPAAVFLPDWVTHAIAVDLEGDGDRELLVVTGSDAGQGLASLQAWAAGAVDRGEFAVGFTNKVPLRRSASVDELLSGRGRLGIDRDNMIRVRIGEPAKFLLARRDGREVPLVATIGTDTEFDVPCCLTIWEVVHEERLELRLVADTQRYAAELVAADFDGDGTDELLVTEGQFDDPASDILDVSLLRWTGERFARTGFTIPFVASCCTAILDVGETDGAPGEEVLLTGPGTNVATGLIRLTLRDGEPTVERALTDGGEVPFARAVSLARGPTLLTSDGTSWLRVWSWPRDGVPQQLAVRNTGGGLAAVFGTGDATRILVVSSWPPSSVQVLAGDLWSGTGPAFVFGRDTREGAFTGTVIGGDEATLIQPYFGVVPGGLPGAREAFVFSGQMVRPLDSLDDLADSVPLALLPGIEPVGTLGPSREWVALLSGFTGFETRGQAVDLRWAREPATLRLVATASLMEPEANNADLEPTFHGAAPDPRFTQSLIVGDEAVDAEIHGPPGSTVWWSTRGDAGSTTIGLFGVARIRLLEPAGSNAPEGSGATASIWVVTPAGHAYSGIWRIRVYRQPPSLAISADEALVNFRPSVSGQTVPGATVTINGVPVEVTANGRFASPVAVGILPTDVRIVAVDPVGNRSERVVSLVWPLDYRQLPFVPLAVGITLGAALVLFLRRPDTGPSRRTPDDGATFEEIGG